MGNLSLICECSRSESLVQSVSSGGCCRPGMTGGVGGGCLAVALAFSLAL